MDVPTLPQQAQVPPQPPSLFSLIVLILTLCVGLALSLSAGYFKQIFANFASYRCNPLMMPFAGLFGYNATENFQFCLGNLLQGRLAEVFSPLFTLLGTFGTTLEMVVNAALGLRKLFSNFLLTVNGFIANVRDRIQMLMTEVRMSFLKLKELMGKVYGTMYAVIWMGTSGLTAEGNLADNDLVKFMMEFCFAPDTVVLRENGGRTTLDSLQIGDRLWPLPSGHVPVVTSLFRFDGSKTPMVRIGDVVVSASHSVDCGEGGLGDAADHPDARPSPSLPHLCCLNVTGHRFLVGSTLLLAADYDEDESAPVVEATQALALHALNNHHGAPCVADYSLGLSEDVEVHLETGAWKRLGAIAIGDVVANAGVVKGVVQEVCASVVATPVGPMAAAQLVFSAMTWKRAATLWPAVPGSPTLNHLITERCGVLEVRVGRTRLYLRDYREVALPEMEAAYATALKSTASVRCVTPLPPVPGCSATASNNAIVPPATRWNSAGAALSITIP